MLKSIDGYVQPVASSRISVIPVTQSISNVLSSPFSSYLVTIPHELLYVNSVIEIDGVFSSLLVAGATAGFGFRAGGTDGVDLDFAFPIKWATTAASQSYFAYRLHLYVIGSYLQGMLNVVQFNATMSVTSSGSILNSLNINPATNLQIMPVCTFGTANAQNAMMIMKQHTKFV